MRGSSRGKFQGTGKDILVAIGKQQVVRNICHHTIEDAITHSSQTYSAPETTIPYGHCRLETPKSLTTPTHDPLQGRGKTISNRSFA
jgi:hypothetical protein